MSTKNGVSKIYQVAVDPSPLLTVLLRRMKLKPQLFCMVSSSKSASHSFNGGSGELTGTGIGSGRSAASDDDD